jgi:hypothetical protein
MKAKQEREPNGTKIEDQEQARLQLVAIKRFGAFEGTDVHRSENTRHEVLRRCRLLDTAPVA